MLPFLLYKNKILLEILLIRMRKTDLHFLVNPDLMGNYDDEYRAMSGTQGDSG